MLSYDWKNNSPNRVSLASLWLARGTALSKVLYSSGYDTGVYALGFQTRGRQTKKYPERIGVFFLAAQAG
jgi:hypothetical protein